MRGSYEQILNSIHVLIIIMLFLYYLNLVLKLMKIFIIGMLLLKSESIQYIFILVYVHLNIDDAENVIQAIYMHRRSNYNKHLPFLKTPKAKRIRSLK